MKTHLRIEVRQVVAAFWRTSLCLAKEGGLTHAAEVTKGKVLRVICNRVSVDSLCDMALSTPPTCPVCARRLAKE